MRLLERAIRRAELPIKMTEGFNPHSKISMLSALGVGVESLDEIMEISLTRWISPLNIKNQLEMQLPVDIKITNIEPFDRKNKTQVDFFDYEITGFGTQPDIESKIKNLLGRSQINIERCSDKDTKILDIRKYILDINYISNKILVRIKNTSSGSAKPNEILKALGIEFTSSIHICKVYSELAKSK